MAAENLNTTKAKSASHETRGRAHAHTHTVERTCSLGGEGARFRRASVALALIVSTWSSVTLASFGGSYGSFNDPGFGFVMGALFALLPMMLCVIWEWRARIRPFALPVFFIVLALHLAFIGRALWFMQGLHDNVVWAVWMLPSMVVLLLCRWLPTRTRLVSGWIFAIAVLLVLWHVLPDQSDRRFQQMALLAGALVCLMGWTLSNVLMVQSSALDSTFVTAAKKTSRAQSSVHIEHPAKYRNALAAHSSSGLRWFCGGLVVVYGALAILRGFGVQAIEVAAASMVYQVTDFFGAGFVSGARNNPFWLIHLPVLSGMLAFGVWGVAAILGQFDSKGMRHFRLFAVVLAFVVLVWYMVFVGKVHSIEARERAVQGMAKLTIQ